MKLVDLKIGDVVKMCWEGDDWCIAHVIKIHKEPFKIMFSDLYSSVEGHLDSEYFLSNTSISALRSIEFLYHHNTMQQEFAIRFPEYSI